MDVLQCSRDLKKTQLKYDEQISKLVENLEEHALKRQVDYKECEELARHAGRMANRWRKMTSVSVEAFAEFDNEMKIDSQNIKNIQFLIDGHSRDCETLDNENTNLNNLISVMEQVISTVDKQ